MKLYRRMKKGRLPKQPSFWFCTQTEVSVMVSKLVSTQTDRICDHRAELDDHAREHDRDDGDELDENVQ